MTGGRDRLVEPSNSVRLAARLVAAGNAATILTYRRGSHFIIIAAVAPLLRFLGPVMRDVEAFIAATSRRAAKRRSRRRRWRSRTVSQFSAAICCGAPLHPCAGKLIGQS
jgi:acetyl esterase/lipase